MKTLWERGGSDSWPLTQTWISFLILPAPASPRHPLFARLRPPSGVLARVLFQVWATARRKKAEEVMGG